ncbi:MAG TPA: hypothetical protein GYA10_12770 [Alphaproteobacteria bacterium]|nr:hypothetical protein [Alphaproteobacteria bacterium]
MTPEARAERARQFREEAAALLTETGLFALLELRFGKAIVTGSAGYDLMVWRHIDIHMPVESDRWAEWATFGGELARQLEAVELTLHKANFLNGYIDPHPLGAGLCWGLEFGDYGGNLWTCDLWGWEPLDFQLRLARDDSLRVDLARADRDLILRLKVEARARPDYYGVKVSSFDIYQFAIERAGNSLEELEAWKQARRAAQ